MTAEELRRLLTNVPDYFQLWRSMITPGGCGSDVMSHSMLCAMENADYLAADAVNLYRHCHLSGTIPSPSKEQHQKLTPRFWFVNGVCRGVKDADSATTLAALETVCWWLMRPVAGEIVTTPGADRWLRQLERSYNVACKRFPSEQDQWLDEAQAQRLTGKTDRTLRRWRETDQYGDSAVRYIDDEYGLLYSKRSLEFRMSLTNGNQKKDCQDKTPA